MGAYVVTVTVDVVFFGPETRKKLKIYSIIIKGVRLSQRKTLHLPNNAMRSAFLCVQLLHSPISSPGSLVNIDQASSPKTHSGGGATQLRHAPVEC